MISPISNLTVTSSSVSSHSLQAAVELVYVQVANDLLVNHMASLENSIGITQNVMNTLTTIQNLHNTVSIVSTGAFNFNFATGTTASAYEASYSKQASAFFGGPIKLSAVFPSGFAAFQSQILAAKSQLSAEIPQLSAVTPVPSNGIPSPNTLLARIKKVLTDLNSTNVGVEAGAMKWITDNYNNPNAAGGTSAGQYQQDITTAITAGQSLNTTQTESVRNFLYLFEEYYKSASAILTQMTQIIQKMADGIAH